MRITNDSAFKDLMADREFAVAMMKQYLPKELCDTIDFNNAELRRASVEHTRPIDRDNTKKSELSDMVFSLKTYDDHDVFCFFHSENHVREERNIPFFVKAYQHAIISDYLRSKGAEGKNAKLPLIFSIVIYGNKRPYPYSTDVLDAFHHVELAKKYAFKTFFVDLTTKSDDELLAHQPEIAAYELSFKSSFHFDLDKKLKIISQALVYDDNHIRRKKIIRYIAEKSSEPPQEIFDIITEYQHELESDVKSTAQQLRDEGLQKGIEQGREKTINQTAIKMLKKGLDIDLISECTGLSYSQINLLRDNLS